MKRPSFKQRFRYWFDYRMSRGTASMIWMLAFATAAFIFVVAAVVALLGLQEEDSFGGTVWDSFASTVNAWVFYSDDGSLGYVAAMALAAVAGLFVTSILIGIIGSAIEEKLASLRRGNSLVLEQGHIVILGFNQEVYRIIDELCLACADRKRQCIVVMGGEDKETMDEGLREQLDIPDNMHVICRSGRTSDPAALHCCSIPSCRTVIVNETSDRDTIKTILAVSSLLKDSDDSGVRAVACVTGERSVVPAEIAGEGRVDVLHVDDIIARLLAHTCRQAGISSVVTGFFSFAGDELYIESFPALVGTTFGEAALRFKKTAPLGIYRGKEVLLNPARDSVIESGDRLVVLAADNGVSELLPKRALPDESAFADDDPARHSRRRRILVFGWNDKFETMARELDAALEKGSLLEVAGVSEKGAAELKKLAAELKNLKIAVLEVDLGDREQLIDLVKAGADSVAILSDTDKDGEEADADTLLLLLQLRDVKQSLGLRFHITTEMRLTVNQQLAQNEDVSDFIISADIAGPLAAQIAENHELLPVFKELLSNDGNEIYLRDADDYVVMGREVSAATLVEAAGRHGGIFLGYKKCSGGEPVTVINPRIDDAVTLQEGDALILLSRK